MRITGTKMETNNGRTLAADVEGSYIVFTLREKDGTIRAQDIMNPIAAESFALSVRSLAKQLATSRRGR